MTVNVHPYIFLTTCATVIDALMDEWMKKCPDFIIIKEILMLRCRVLLQKLHTDNFGGGWMDDYELQ